MHIFVIKMGGILSFEKVTDSAEQAETRVTGRASGIQAQNSLLIPGDN
jgi:hypothetical protein